MTGVEQLVALSRYAGSRFDLVQAGGGNASIKNGDGTMQIKASGCLLSEVDADYGHIRVDNDKISSFLRKVDSLPADRGE